MLNDRPTREPFKRLSEEEKEHLYHELRKSQEADQELRERLKQQEKQVMVFEFCCPNDGTPYWLDESCIGKEILCLTCNSLIEVEDQRDRVEPRQTRGVLLNPKAYGNHMPSLSKKQKRVLICGIALFVLAGLYPPWRFILRGPYGISSSRNIGHSMSAPSYTDFYDPAAKDDFYHSSPEWVEARIDVQALGVEWIILTVITLGTVLLFKSPPADTKKGK